MHNTFDGFYQGKFFMGLLLETQDSEIKAVLKRRRWYGVKSFI